VKTIDNGAAGFAATGKWHVQKNKGGYERDIQFAEKAGKKDKKLATATWTFTDLAAGQYRVSVTAPRSPSYAKDAPFSVFDGTTLLGTVLVNQKGAPLSQKKGHGKTKTADVQWQSLGTFTISGNSLVVQLTNRASGHVVADAVHIEQVTSDPLVPPPSLPSNDTGSPPAPGGSQTSTPALTPQQLQDIATELSLLDQTNSFLDDLAADLANRQLGSVA
jgi:hypothetical protein